MFLDEARALGGLRVWNYAKTPTRGVGHLQIYVDHRLMFDGHLRPAQGASKTVTAAPFFTQANVCPEVIPFTPEAGAPLPRGSEQVVASASLSAPMRVVRCIDDGVFKEGPEDASPGGPKTRPARPRTSVVGTRR